MVRVISVFVYGLEVVTHWQSENRLELAGSRVASRWPRVEVFDWLLCSLRLTNTVCFGKEVLFGFCRSDLRRDHLL